MVSLPYSATALNKDSSLARGLNLFLPMTTRLSKFDSFFNAMYYQDISPYRQYGFVQDAGNQFATYKHDGPFGNAHNMDLASGGIRILNSDTGGPTKPKFVTFSLWVKIDNILIHPVQGLGGNGQFGSNGWTAVLFDNGTLGFFIKTTAGQFAYSPGTHTLVNNVWYFLTFMFDGRYIKGYVNGELDGLTDIGTYSELDYTGNTSFTLIGAGNFPNRDMRAKFNYVTVHNRAITQQEMFTLYKRPESLLMHRPKYMSLAQQIVAANKSSMFLAFQ